VRIRKRVVAEPPPDGVRLINVTGTLRKLYAIGANKMWLITPTGFFSIVCKPGDRKAGTLTIRARVKSDLEALRQQCLPSLGKVTENEGTDYPYRAKAKRSEVAKALAQMVEQLDYDNFKNEVAEKQGHHRAKVYHEVWDVLYDLEKKTANSSKSAAKNSKTKSASGQKPTAYGGIILDEKKRVLLRRPRGDFDRYVWTFPKGRPAPELAALREVKEETGYSAKVIKELSLMAGTNRDPTSSQHRQTISACHMIERYFATRLCSAPVDLAFAGMTPL
jgi:ADP-ribose pyrophosphatase YjhB (NUDIX family)